MTETTSTPPTNTLTFLFTDIEGSTQLWERDPEAMQAALARHDDILRQAIETHNGRVFKTMGDEFCAVFSSAPDGLSAALAAQQALYTEPWGKTPIKVRMALHAGPAEERDGDYFGLTLNRVARLMAAGHGGQTLLSAATHELMQAHLPPNVSLRDMGERRLKDLARPDHIYQLLAPDLPTDFPPLKTLEAFRTNLPAQLTSFIGREEEIAAVKELIAQNRMVTLTGAGGAGKTRLSLQVAADLLDSFPNGIWFVELAPLTDPALVPQTVVTAIRLHNEGNRPALTVLSDYLRAKTALLVLDNCEHLIEAAAQLSEALLQACPNLRTLTSSREALGIPGEISYRVPSLSTPDIRRLPPIKNLTEYEAVRLFSERAQTALPSFTITKENAPAIAQVCARLDGIPLAIELAAARVKMLKVEQIAERLDDRFHLLTGGSRTALPRHQTLRAMIDWSYDLLPKSERALLCRLSVFSGGWTLESAETVCQGEGIPDHDVLDLLTQLVNKSLVVVDTADANEGYTHVEARYHLLETVRQYAREKLMGMGEGIQVRNRHLEYFLGLAERTGSMLVGPHVVEWVQRWEIELDNVRTALKWSLSSQTPELGLRLANALWWFWTEGGHVHDGYGWLNELLNHPNAQSHTLARARALGHLGFFLVFGDFGQSTRPILEESLALCRELGDKAGLAYGLLHLGIFLFQRDDAQEEGKKLVIESLEIYRELKNKVGIALVLHYLGSTIEIDVSNYEQLCIYLEEELAICREIEDIASVARSLSDLGDVAIKHGYYDVARRWLEEALTIQKQLGKIGNIIYTLSRLGEVAVRTGDDAQARAYYEEMLSRIHQAGGSLTDTRWVLVKSGYTALWQGDIERARNLLEESLRYFIKLNEKIGVVYALEGLGSLAVLQGHFERTAQLFAWANETRKLINGRRPPVEQADVDRDLAAVRTQLDEAAFAAAQAKGRAMTMDEAIACALETKNS